MYAVVCTLMSVWSICSVEVAPGSDPDDSTADVECLPGTQAKEPAATGSC